MSKRVTVEDLTRVRYVSDPQISPEGNRVAFVITVPDPVADTYRSVIHAMPLGGGAPVAITEGSMPRWSPDGKRLAYVAGKQVWVREDLGESRSVTDLPGGVSHVAWSPDGTRLALIAEVSLPAAPLGPTQGLHHITRLKYKGDGRGFIYGHRPQLFVTDLGTGGCRQLTDSPHGAESPAWSPDGADIGFITAPGDPDGTWDRTVMRIPAGGGSPAPVCEAVGAQDLAWSPDGRSVAFRAACRQYDPSVSFGLWVAPAGGGAPVLVTRGFDRFVGNDRTLTDTMWGKQPQGGVWSADSRSLYFIAADRGENSICRVPAAGGPVERVNVEGGPQAVYNFSYDPFTGAIVAAAATALIPGDLWRLPDGLRLTAVNDHWLSEVALTVPVETEWTSGDGTKVQGWILKPPGFDAARKYPAILQVHGGPYRQYGHTFFHEMQLLAAEGYVVLYSNPRGSQGYGQEFAYAIHNDWGHHDYADLMSGVDHLLAQGYVDPERVGVTGGSYGGYMTNWIVTQTGRFKAAVTDRCLSNVHSFMGTADVAVSFGEQIYGNVWNPAAVARMLERSPITHVANVTTPLLIMHQMEDHCCPQEQAEQFYTALKRLGRTTELLLFPGAGHELSRGGRPSQRVHRLQWIVAWFANYM